MSFPSNRFPETPRCERELNGGHNMSSSMQTFDVVVVGGGPSGATAANDLARQGRSVLLLDRAGRIKPCGGAIPPKAMEEFDVPESLLVAKVNSARMVSPKNVAVDMPINGGYVGIVNRETFDEWLRQRAATAGADLRHGTFTEISRDSDGTAIVHYKTRERDARAGAHGDRRRRRDVECGQAVCAGRG
jgi:geranylgeranyl reductase